MKKLGIRIAAMAALLSGCGGGGGGSEGSAPVPPPLPANQFAAVDAAAEAAFGSEAGLSGMGLSVYSSDGALVFQKMYGDFATDRRVAIASASKMVSGIVLFRLIEQGYLSLDSTTGEVLGWTGANAAITFSVMRGVAPPPKEWPANITRVLSMYCG